MRRGLDVIEAAADAADLHRAQGLAVALAVEIDLDRRVDRHEALEFGQHSVAERLLALADQVQLLDNQTRWVELESYSTRQRRSTQIGGLVGTATYRAVDWQPFAPWLVWGSLLGVGKNTVKGDGWYAINALTGW